MSKKSKSEAIEAKLAEMRKQLDDARREEAEAADRELLRLAHRAGCVDELTQIATRRVEQQRRAKAQRKEVATD